MLWGNFAAMLMLGGVLFPMSVKEYPRIRATYPNTWLAKGWRILPWLVGFAAIYSGVVWLIFLLR